MSDKDGRSFRFTDKDCVNEAHFDSEDNDTGNDCVNEAHFESEDDVKAEHGMSLLTWTLIGAIALSGAALGGAWLLDYI